MTSTQTKQVSSLSLGAYAGIGAGLFLPGVILQVPMTNWFPEQALASGEMTLWLEQLSQHTFPALLGVGLSIIAIICFLPFGFTLYQWFPKNNWRSTAGLTAYLMGSGLALTAFTFAFGFSWALSDMLGRGTPAEDLHRIATMGMQAYVFSDDIATALIGLGHLMFAGQALRQDLLPKWLSWWGIISGVLVGLVLLRYFLPLFSVAQFGYPLVILWFVLVGVRMLGLRNGD